MTLGRKSATINAAIAVRNSLASITLFSRIVVAGSLLTRCAFLTRILMFKNGPYQHTTAIRSVLRGTITLFIACFVQAPLKDLVPVLVSPRFSILVFVQFPAPPPQTHLPPDSPLMLGFRVYNLDLGFSALGV